MSQSAGGGGRGDGAGGELEPGFCSEQTGSFIPSRNNSNNIGHPTEQGQGNGYYSAVVVVVVPQTSNSIEKVCPIWA